MDSINSAADLNHLVLKKFMENVARIAKRSSLSQADFLDENAFIAPEVLKKAIMTDEAAEAFKKDAEPLTYTEEGAEVDIWVKRNADDSPAILFETYRIDPKIHKWKEGAKISYRIPTEHVPASQKPTS